jgi:NAD(P)-dependent dehydrogenase (short-subunit alcohol dehydrogenase family)
VSGRLTGEVALVTGSTRGLGREVARVFAEEGAAVVVTGRDAGRGEAVAAELHQYGAPVAFVAADLGVEDDCERLVGAAVERFGRLSILVNNAYGSDDIAADRPVAELTTSAWESILRINLTAVIWMCRFAIREMQASGGGSIVNVSARAAERGTPGMAAHAATKGAINALTRSIAVDYARDNIRSNAVAPGHVLHETRDAALTRERRAALEGMHLTRLATATDIARGVLYLASRDSEVVTGTVLALDGGSSTTRAWTLGGPDPRWSEPGGRA